MSASSGPRGFTAAVGSWRCSDIPDTISISEDQAAIVSILWKEKLGEEEAESGDGA
jgi:hypothetical protein